jgi:DNA replication protein DnaC
MNAELMDYFRGLGCNELPEVDEQDARMFLRQRSLCRECPGLDGCREHGSLAVLALTQDKARAYIAIGTCKLRKARDLARRAERLFAEAAIPASLRGCRLENYVTQGRGEDIERAKAAAARAIETGCSLVLGGAVGTGKTHLAAAIARAALDRGGSALFISAIGYLHRLKSTFDKKQASLYAEMVDHVKTVNCLVIDDLGAEKPTSWTVERLYDVINARMEQQMQTVITTNFTDTADLLEHLKSDSMGGMRIASRLIAIGWLTIEGEDYRKTLRKQNHGVSRRASYALPM